jgi:hypothetical protein
VLDLLIGLTQQMVEGEFVQMEKLGRTVGEAEYYDLIYRKTACLFDVSMRLGAVLAGAPEETEEQMGEYGRNLGIAFQIVDDVLDLTANDDVLGKPAASDLREGKATLAVIHALERGTGADREAIRTVLADRSFARVAHADILGIVVLCDGYGVRVCGGSSAVDCGSAGDRVQAGAVVGAYVCDDAGPVEDFHAKAGCLSTSTLDRMLCLAATNKYSSCRYDRGCEVESHDDSLRQGQSIAHVQDSSRPG